MSEYECIDRLGGWEGYRVAAVERFEVAEAGGRSRVWIALQPKDDRSLRCGRCGSVAVEFPRKSGHTVSSGSSLDEEVCSCQQGDGGSVGSSSWRRYVR